MKSSARWRAICPPSSPTRLSAASCMRIPTCSDGVDPLDVMAEATRSAAISTLVSPIIPSPRITRAAFRSRKSLQQHRAIDRLNKSYGKDFRILKGIESDILADGSLDYPDEVLDALRLRRGQRA